jgi:hypothetical protein
VKSFTCTGKGGLVLIFGAFEFRREGGSAGSAASHTTATYELIDNSTGLDVLNPTGGITYSTEAIDSGAGNGGAAFSKSFTYVTSLANGATNTYTFKHSGDAANAARNVDIVNTIITCIYFR